MKVRDLIPPLQTVDGDLEATLFSFLVIVIERNCGLRALTLDEGVVN
jgi:hypothetical protein